MIYPAVSRSFDQYNYEVRFLSKLTHRRLFNYLYEVKET